MLETMTLGRDGQSISRLGLGCWAFGGHGWGVVRDEDSVAAIKYGLDHGLTHFDTADVYGFGKSEQILRKTLGQDRKKVVIASKGGVRWESAGKIRKDCSPAYLRQAVEASLRRLDLDCIPLYYIHWPDGQTPVTEAVGCLQRLLEEGKIGAIGLSNFSARQVEEALGQASIQSIQVQLNIFQQGKALRLLDICNRHGITMVAWGALCDGLLTGKFNSLSSFGSDDHRSRSPMFQGDNFINNLEIVEKLKPIAALRNVSLGQLALRWILDWSDSCAALFGARTREQLRDNLGANGWRISQPEMLLIEEALSPTNC